MSNGRILIVEDDADIREMVAEYLGGQGYEVQQAQSGGQQAAQGQGESSAGMRSAAEQMGRAAADMRHEDAQSAATSADRAAEQLRTLEQQMRGSGADARQRAAADLLCDGRAVGSFAARRRYTATRRAGSLAS